jgi:hypothetical protein
MYTYGSRTPGEIVISFAKKNILGVMGRDRKFESPPEQSFTLLKASHILSSARRSSSTCSAFQDIQCSRE